MRVANSLAAKPPNTTECIAPMRAQASIADDRLGDHWHIDQHPVARVDAEILQHRAAAFTSVQQFRIGEVRFVPVTGLS